MSNSFNGVPYYTNCSTYYEFLEMFGPEHTFQTFCDKGKNKKVIKQLHGTIKQHFHELADLNKQGAGVFFTVNETDLLGRTTKHIKKVRAVFVDLDGSPLPEKFTLLPHLIVNTSPDKYHCYWLVSDMPLESFTLYQKALAEKLGGDEKLKDLPRVMRVAGFYHNKNKPYPIKIISTYKIKPYTREEIKNGLKLERPKPKVINFTSYESKYSGSTNYGASEGDRHERLVRMLIGIRLRGESYEYARGEALEFARACNPPENPKEAIFQLNDIWSRYAPVTSLSNKSNR
mgnify:CR=1 FL=1